VPLRRGRLAEIHERKTVAARELFDALDEESCAAGDHPPASSRISSIGAVLATASGFDATQTRRSLSFLLSRNGI